MLKILALRYTAKVKMDNLIKSFLNQKNFAIVGSFRNESKVAWKILKNLKSRGISVYPVNPGIKEVEGMHCWNNISEIREPIDVVNMVTSPVVTEKLLRECYEKGIKKIWLQPGAESESAINYCRDNKIEVVHGLCVMLETA